MRSTMQSITVATLTVLALAGTSGAEQPFTGPGIVNTGINGPSSVDAADFNNDGHMDVAITLIEAGEVRIRFGGPSPWAHTLDPSFTSACYVRAADINGDGWLDVVASNRGNTVLVSW